MLEVGVDHTVGESFTTNTDTFKYTVTCQLVHNQVRIDNTWKKTTTKNRRASVLVDISNRRYKSGDGGGAKKEEKGGERGLCRILLHLFFFV